MKRLARSLLLASLALLIAGSALAGDKEKTCAAAASSAAGQNFGAPIKVKKCTSVAALAKDPARLAGKRIRIEGTVKDVCQGVGCWIEVADADGASFLARSLDESVLVPKDCKGRTVVVQGKVKLMPMKTAEAEAAKAKAEGHACPAPQWVLATEGVELR